MGCAHLYAGKLGQGLMRMSALGESVENASLLCCVTSQQLSSSHSVCGALFLAGGTLHMSFFAVCLSHPLCSVL